MAGTSVTPEGSGTVADNGGHKDTLAEDRQGVMRAREAQYHQGLARMEKETRIAVIRECVTWLVLNHSTYKPEFLAENLAEDVGKGEV